MDPNRMAAADADVADHHHAGLPTLVGRKPRVESHPRIVGAPVPRVHEPRMTISSDATRPAGKKTVAVNSRAPDTLRMTRPQQRLAILIAVPGAIASMIALTGFVLRILNNQLELPLVATLPAFYNAVGDAYGEGFTAGFSLCFFLTLLAVAVSTWYEKRR